MATYGVAEAKDRLPALIAAAERGEPVTITRYGRPVAELRPVDAAPAPRRPQPMDQDAMDRFTAALAALGLPKLGVDGATLVDQMREADHDPELDAAW